MLLLPAGIEQFLAGKRIKHSGLDAMYKAPRLAVGGNQVIPTPGDMSGRPESEDTIRERIALMMIEEQPTINLFSSERFLYAF